MGRCLIPLSLAYLLPHLNVLHQVPEGWSSAAEEEWVPEATDKLIQLKDETCAVRFEESDCCYNCSLEFTFWNRRVRSFSVL
jgi:hypothetical protein